MSNLLEYKKYHGSVEFSAEDRCFFGKIIGIGPLVTYEGESVETIESAFHESVDSYLDLCRRNAIKPDREYSGQLKFRPGPDLHKQIDMHATKTGESINTVIVSACEFFLGEADHVNELNEVTINYYDYSKTQALLEPMPYSLSDAREYYGGAVKWRKSVS
ncbi:MAG: type II toxin-antitoxin system HicB family antitoxin [Clostridiales Family XIII bacterium]|jgi:predicted HicB family RNase H-like nuclease|nr:type II toxin-antitoxin system HicB family antitoxin [Clostridiales Family XIII bacterium]